MINLINTILLRIMNIPNHSFKVRPQLPSIFASIYTEQYSSRLRVLEQNFEQNKRFLRALLTGRIMLNNKNKSEGKFSQCACFLLEILKEFYLVFGIYCKLHSFRKISIG